MNFDAGFLSRLKQRDPDTCAFLVSSFASLLQARLRYRLRNHGEIEDICSETFYRVFRLVDEGRIRQPEQFGSFVRGICDRVAQESRRKSGATESLTAGMDAPDPRPQIDRLLVEKERKSLVWREVMKLPEADRRLIVELHWEERDRCEMARNWGVSTAVLNVRLCRVLKRLRRRFCCRNPRFDRRAESI